MTLSFKDRLNRIADSQTVDARAQTKVDVSPQTGSVLNPTHAGPNTRTFVISYCLVGILWMYPTGWILGNYDIIHALLLRRPDVTQDATQSALIIWISAMLSMLLFFTYFRFVYPQFSLISAGLAHRCVFVSGLIALVLAYGPLRTLTELMEGR